MYLFQFLHFQSTFIWNFSDLFVICMSYYLTSRLQYVNKKLLAAQGKYLPEVFWRTSREEYGRAVQLVRKVDDVISGIVFISFANNLFFICLQLFNTLENGIKGAVSCRSGKQGSTILGGYEAAVYFLFSLIYLISRSVAVSLIASQVNSASTVPASVLYDVPSPVYCLEVQRFLEQVNGEKIALSGLQFFSVTRSLLLTVAGTIVTYELVMFQFKSPDQ
ncbi:gustatory receptor for sugar taste 64f-like [Leptidea sinapis]|uniref:gustatory receptor for sugar taste 64f-like n=1 Tax=Leptidea sinapis TaxID=189913 RepID=UPI0021C4B813|nr:gustatory receptor for sugar taste 64f-like [Leptidea sinapis]